MCVCVCVCACVCVCVAIWKVIRSWLTAQQRDRTLLVNKAELSEYVSSEQLEAHMVHTAQ